MRFTEQEVPKPDKYQGQGEVQDGLLTGQDNRLGYPSESDELTTVEQLKAMRNNRNV